jgi:hypothetical protein
VSWKPARPLLTYENVLGLVPFTRVMAAAADSTLKQLREAIRGQEVQPRTATFGVLGNVLKSVSHA